MTTDHYFIDKYPIPNDSEKLILGTIHPYYDVKEFKIPFFYGNRPNLWKILNAAFPEELTDPLSLKAILSFISSKKIAVSDIIAKCERKTPSRDSDIITESILYNGKLIEQINASKINEIFFTSGFQKNNAFRLFYVGLLKQKITNEIKILKSVTDNVSFNRPIKLTILFSPSGMANISIVKAKEYLDNKKKYKTFQNPIQAFKIDYYKNKFTF